MNLDSFIEREDVDYIIWSQLVDYDGNKIIDDVFVGGETSENVKQEINKFINKNKEEFFEEYGIAVTILLEKNELTLKENLKYDIF